MEKLEEKITQLLDRNKKVEADKAWETSITRKVFLSLLTYIFAFLWLWLIQETLVWLKAFVPVLGYVISTLTPPRSKTGGLKIRQNKKYIFRYILKYILNTPSRRMRDGVN